MPRITVPDPVLFFQHSVYIPYDYTPGQKENFVSAVEARIEAESKRLCEKFGLKLDDSLFFSQTALRLYGENLANVQAASMELSGFLKAQAGLVFTEVEEELV
ncbi:hypothetical protein [Pseudomonas mosselii]|uniref:hypothetical protein n=1 Tax=Pseudomonas mosselii TaxID=78327 RepID=UPI0021D8CEC6|nr:hypothetical protein [Pseudomonas mosselii]MCU9529310.1 hypothetical protein [Pseudomonas mosselii]MCU9536601.1 hypothetical protein [Pseudomonas mosselii]MCU9542221.1 hypothetical protein [Pseudomonas mosselii]MCU9548326.1 hypothetical protein [Pseudomonas mosselii]